jgi:hypothetical protein
MSIALTESTHEQERDIDVVYDALLLRLELSEADFNGNFESVAA